MSALQMRQMGCGAGSTLVRLPAILTLAADTGASLRRRRPPGPWHRPMYRPVTVAVLALPFIFLDLPVAARAVDGRATDSRQGGIAMSQHGCFSVGSTVSRSPGKKGLTPRLAAGPKPAPMKRADRSVSWYRSDKPGLRTQVLILVKGNFVFNALPDTVRSCRPVRGRSSKAGSCQIHGFLDHVLLPRSGPDGRQ